MTKRRRPVPKVVRILNTRIPVERVDGLTHSVHDEEGNDVEHYRAYGVYDPLTPVIYLEDVMGWERSRVTLLHETLHAIIDLAHFEGSDNEEGLVSRMAPLVLDFIRSNPGIIAFLQETST